MDQRKQAWRAAAFLSGAGLGAALMYLLDPDGGARRRARLRDRGIHAAHRREVGFEKALRDLTHRVDGAAARLRQAVTPDDATDAVITERVRARLGRLVERPGAIAVDTAGGLVRLAGPVLAEEHGALLRGVRAVRGVRGVEDALSVQADGEGAHDEPRRRGRREWSPALRLLGGGLGLALGIDGLRRRGVLGGVSAALGTYLVARAATGGAPAGLLGVGARIRAIELQRTLRIRAPVEEVFAVLDDLAGYPRFMADLRAVEVDPARPGHARWIYNGASGSTLEWETETVTRDAPRELEWRSSEGARLDHRGHVRLEPIEEGRATRLDIHLTYGPPPGGDAAVQPFRRRPERAFEEDLARLVRLCEARRAPGPRATEDQPS